jgi:molecular chaperone DnaJ
MATDKRDYYEVLGVSKDASTDQIKGAFKKLARTYHPDVAQDKAEAEIKFREINEAYSVLSDSDKRSHYDRFGHQAPPGAGGFGGGSPFGDMFDLGDIFESVFGGMGGGGGRGGNRPTRGDDVKMSLELTLEEVFKGCERQLEVEIEAQCSTCKGSRCKPGSRPATCSQCQGTGQLKSVARTPFGQVVRSSPCLACRGQGQTVTDPCTECRGEGLVEERKKVSVKVPAGVDSGNYIRMTGYGNAGSLGGPPGDLYVELLVKPHEVFHREGDDLAVDKLITFTDAALGAEVEVPTLEGPSRLKVPHGTQSHTVFKVRGKGLPSMRRAGARGDLHVRAIVMVPTHLNDKQKSILQTYAAAGSQDAQLQSGKGWLGRIMDAILG